jgi:membrane protein DedA with SNARE-associated domain
VRYHARVPSLQDLARTLGDVAAVTGPWAPLILFGATFVEHVFPPFPGDALVVLGAWYAVQGAVSWPLLLLVTTAGAVAGAWVDYRVGAWIGAGLERRADHSRLLPPARLAAFDAAYQRWGGWLVLLNRFMPGVRAFIFLGAGAAHLPLPRVLLLGGLSGLAWNALLLSAGGLVARNVDDLLTLVDRYTWAAAAVLAVAALGLLVRAAARRREAR